MTTETRTPADPHASTTDPACGVQRDFGEHHDDGTHVCNDGPGHFVGGSPHTCRCGYRWAATGQPSEPTEEDYTAAVEKLDTVYGYDADQLISMIETTRDEEIVHDSNAEQDGICVGCLTETIAVAVTRAVNGKAA